METGRFTPYKLVITIADFVCTYNKIGKKKSASFFTASYYDIRFTNNEADFSDETLWDGLRKISAEDVISGSMNPVEAGTTVAFEVFIDMFAPDDIIFLSMRSCDNLNQTSEISKPFKLILDIIPPADVMDMVATLYDSNVEITFTAPGDDKENGTGKKSIFFLWGLHCTSTGNNVILQ